MVIAWTVGGVFLLWWKPNVGNTTITQIAVRGALIIGLAQSLALWPGVSRSLVTIVAGLAIGCDMASAVEFSFLLGLATLVGGDGARPLQGRRHARRGLRLAHAAARRARRLRHGAAAVRWLVSYLRTRPLTIFGYYRLGMAALAVILLATGAI